MIDPAIVTRLAIATTAGFAALALYGSGAARLHRGLFAFALACAILNAIGVAWPVAWTPEAYGATQATLAALACVAGLGMARRGFQFRVRAWRATSVEALGAFAVAALVGAHALELPHAERWGYRGVAFVSAAACALLSTLIAGALRRGAPREPIATTALPALAGLYALQTVYLASFELSLAWAHRLGWITAGGYVVALLLIAVAAAPFAEDGKLSEAPA